MTVFEPETSFLDSRTHRFQIVRDGKPVTWREALELWQNDEEFRDCFVGLLADSPFSAFRWETPAVTRKTLNHEFEFVLLDAPGLARTADTRTFARQFSNADEDGIVAFENLGKDAMMVVPAPISVDSAYDQLAGFIPVSYTHLTLPTKA